MFYKVVFFLILFFTLSVLLLTNNSMQTNDVVTSYYETAVVLGQESAIDNQTLSGFLSYSALMSDMKNLLIGLTIYSSFCALLTFVFVNSKVFIKWYYRFFNLMFLLCGLISLRAVQLVFLLDEKRLKGNYISQAYKFLISFEDQELTLQTLNLQCKCTFMILLFYFVVCIILSILGYIHSRENARIAMSNKNTQAA